MEPAKFMYLKHYGLSRRPFKLSSDPEFLWTGEKHKAALEALKDGILENKGFVLLTGEVGTGKTTLVNAFPKLNEIATISVTIPDPGMDPLDFCNFLANEFKMNRQFASKDDFVRDFKGFLLRSFATYKKVLVIIDEAQRLDYGLQEEVRQLAGIEMAGRRLLKVFSLVSLSFAICSWMNAARPSATKSSPLTILNPWMPAKRPNTSTTAWRSPELKKNCSLQGKIENEQVHRLGRSHKKPFTVLSAFLIWVVCILAGGYLAFRLGLHEPILKLIL
jgi:energy-coupling factor transporter ATP-binding protein EcfA2